MQIIVQVLSTILEWAIIAPMVQPNETHKTVANALLLIEASRIHSNPTAVEQLCLYVRNQVMSHCLKVIKSAKNRPLPDIETEEFYTGVFWYVAMLQD